VKVCDDWTALFADFEQVISQKSVHLSWFYKKPPLIANADPIACHRDTNTSALRIDGGFQTGHSMFAG